MNFKSRKSLIVVAAIAALAVGAFVCWNIFRGGNGHRESSTEITAVSGKSSQADGSTGSQPTTSESGGYGTFPEVSPDENPAIKASVESIRTGKNPERVSLQIAPKPFDANAWQTDENYRKSYLETVEPGRCYQSAQPGKGVPVLASVGKRYHELIQGETTTLKCRALPGAPVTFTSFDGGWFSANKMTSITVKAGEDGIAKAEFEAIPGTINSCRVLIASPLVTGQLEQKIWIAMPKQASAAKTE